MENELAVFKVEFEVRERMTYEVEAINEDEAIEKASLLACIDYDDAEFLNVWEK